MLIRITKNTNYVTPEGIHQAKLADVIVFEKPSADKNVPQIRLIFEMTSLRHPRFIYMAGRTYSQEKADVLANDLGAWLGDDLLKLMDPDGNLETDKLEALVGKEARVQIVHIQNDSHKDPYCYLKAICPSGTDVAPLAA